MLVGQPCLKVFLLGVEKAYYLPCYLPFFSARCREGLLSTLLSTSVARCRECLLSTLLSTSPCCQVQRGLVIYLSLLLSVELACYLPCYPILFSSSCKVDLLSILLSTFLCSRFREGLLSTLLSILGCSQVQRQLVISLLSTFLQRQMKKRLVISLVIQLSLSRGVQKASYLPFSTVFVLLLIALLPCYASPTHSPSEIVHKQCQFPFSITSPIQVSFKYRGLWCDLKREFPLHSITFIFNFLIVI